MILVLVECFNLGSNVWVKRIELVRFELMVLIIFVFGWLLNFFDNYWVVLRIKMFIGLFDVNSCEENWEMELGWVKL